MANSPFHFLFIVFFISCSLFHPCRPGLLAEPAQPLKPPDETTPNTVPSYPVQTGSEICRLCWCGNVESRAISGQSRALFFTEHTGIFLEGLDLSAELFGGVNAACGRNLDRSRCCPVLAAWFFAAHARSALEVNVSSPATSDDLPMMPDDSQNCVNSLQSSLRSRNIHIPQPNASCDAVLCFCGIRLHQIGSLSCPAAFNVTAGSRNATPTAAVRNLEKSCRNSSYAGCTKCLGALQKLNGDGKNGTKKSHHEGGDRASKILTRDCQLMGLTWLLARNKTAYIPTVSAVLRAIMYSAHPPHESMCSPDQENMPLAVDSLQFDKSNSSASSWPRTTFFLMTILPLLIILI